MSSERIARERLTIEQVGFQIIQSSDAQWVLEKQGPKGSPYEGIPIYLQIVFDNFPQKVPKVRVLNHLYHPSVDTTGCFCPCHLSILEKWAPTKKISRLLEEMWAQLAEPQPDCGVNPTAQNARQKETDLWAQVARDMAKRHIF